MVAESIHSGDRNGCDDAVSLPDEKSTTENLIDKLVLSVESGENLLVENDQTRRAGFSINPFGNQ